MWLWVRWSVDEAGDFDPAQCRCDEGAIAGDRLSFFAYDAVRVVVGLIPPVRQVAVLPNLTSDTARRCQGLEFVLLACVREATALVDGQWRLSGRR